MSANLNGFVLIDKAPGISSAEAVNRVKRCLPKGHKIGHAGTLDPLASGMLPLAVGEGTKLIRFLMDARKIYEFTVIWGEKRSTADAEGAVTATSPVRPAREAIEAVLPRFLGVIMQKPPAYSAIKVGGERAYALARAGETVELAARPVAVHRLSISSHVIDKTTFIVECGKGTYVRSLAEDLAEALGTVGYVGHLRRLRVGPWVTDDAILLEDRRDMEYMAHLSQRVGDTMRPLTDVLDGVPAILLTPAQAQSLRHGQAVRLETLPPEGEEAIATCHGKLVAVVEARQGQLKPLRIIHDA